ncbi:hypothetical protein [Streptomyces bangladeshensis]|uniref:Uncharacterized protein n=1 Tax=Streptomyces bangladeshensis TaxID=295352 RepID=A0ABN3BD55_9ACTN
MTSTARELRAEANLIRFLAESAQPTGDGHWFARCDFPTDHFPGPQWRVRARLWTSRWQQLIGAHAKGADAHGWVDHRVGVYIAAMNPAVGAAVAQLIDRAADHHDAQQPCCQTDDSVFTCPVVAPVLDLITVLRKARALTESGGPTDRK